MINDLQGLIEEFFETILIKIRKERQALYISLKNRNYKETKQINRYRIQQGSFFEMIAGYTFHLSLTLFSKDYRKI